MKIKKCKCGGVDFYVNEGYAWKASLDGVSSTLDCFKAVSEIETIICRSCRKEYSESDFENINFN